MSRWFLMFFFYSLAGCGLEKLYAHAVRSPRRTRKCFLLLPLCPVYGLGACLIVLLASLGRGPLWVAVAGGAAATGAELLMGAFYRFALGVEFWDYGHLPGSLGGLVCPQFSLCWTALALALVYGLHPAVARLAAGIPLWLAPPALIVLGADALVSCVALRQAGTTEVLRWYAAEERVRE